MPGGGALRRRPALGPACGVGTAPPSPSRNGTDSGALRPRRDRPCPLALYVYGRDAALCEEVVARTRSGGAVVNDCITHVAAHPLPFGGAGDSGMGAYHGEEGFRSFTRPRSVMVASRWSPVRMARPPFGAQVERIIRLLLR